MELTDMTPAQLAFIKKAKQKFISEAKLTQVENLFMYLLSGKGLTGPKCLKELRIYRLASRVHDLKHKPWAGFDVQSERLQSGLALYYFTPEQLKTLNHVWRNS